MSICHEFLPSRPRRLSGSLLLEGTRLIPHPEIAVGKMVRRLEILVVSSLGNSRLAGLLLVGVSLAMTALVTWGALILGYRLHPWIGTGVALLAAGSAISLHGFHRESKEVIRSLEEGRIEDARVSLSLLVGRQTSFLSEEEILRTCIEKVAQNTSRGAVAPLLYLFLGGPVLAMLYLTAAVLGYTVGFRTEPNREFGWAAAHLNDLFNLVPSWMTGLLCAVTAFLLRLDGRRSFHEAYRDLPESARSRRRWPEAAFAGALGIRLGGQARYFGEQVEKPVLGSDLLPLTTAHYRSATRLSYGTALLALGMGIALYLVIF